MHVDSSHVLNGLYDKIVSTSVLIFDLSGKISDFNPGFQKLTGYDRESLIGNNIHTLYTEEDLLNDIIGNIIENTVESGNYVHNNFIKRRDGSLIRIYGETILGTDHDGKKYVVKVLHDASKEWLLEQELTLKTKELEKLISDHETFIYTTSHDLRSPINNLDALAQHVEEVHNSPEEIMELLPLINDSIARFRNKLNELSAIGKNREEKNKIGTVYFQSLYNEVLKDLEQEIRYSDTELLSDFSRAPSIRFLKKNLRSILQNLISNALKYRSSDRKSIIKVETEYTDEGAILVKIHDNGLGIGEEEQEKVFEMYHRLHPQIEGTGVGLGIVKKIVGSSGGEIELESKIGEGTLFKVYLKASGDQ